MGPIFRALLAFGASFFQSRTNLQLQVFALQHQLGVLQRCVKRPQIKPEDRILWGWLSQRWSGWKDSLIIVKPDTVVGWSKKRFRDHWRWLSKPGPGRPAVDLGVIDLIRNMSVVNPLWGSPHIMNELHKIGIDVAKSTVERYMVLRKERTPSPSWLPFLHNHVLDMVSIDFFVVPTINFKILFVFIVLAHHRRRMLHFNVTAHPTADWTANQIVQAFPWDEAPRYLLRDRDGAYGAHFRHAVKGMGIEEVLSAPRSPWQNPYIERLIGSIRRECLDHIIVFNARHLRRILQTYSNTITSHVLTCRLTAIAGLDHRLVHTRSCVVRHG
jgi:transposase InsO family protein